MPVDVLPAFKTTTVMEMDDLTPRPAKRQKLDSGVTTPLSSPLTTPPSSMPKIAQDESPLPALKLIPQDQERKQLLDLAIIPPSHLLLALPNIIIHPPTHKYHPLSLHLSLQALRRVSQLAEKSVLEPETEVRAWCGLAEVGMRVLSGAREFSGEWSLGVGREVEKALSKGLLIAQKHPSLRAYKRHLALLQSHVTSHSNPKLARSLLTKHISSTLLTDPPSTLYAAHLSLISSFESTGKVREALDAVENLIQAGNGNKKIIMLASLIHLRIVFNAQLWELVADALTRAESVLGLSFLSPKSPQQEDREPFETCITLQVLHIGVIFHTSHPNPESSQGGGGGSKEATERLAMVHALCDNGGLEAFGKGVVEIEFPSGPPLHINVPYPRTMLLLTYLISSTSKRDSSLRSPKRAKFAQEGLAAYLREVATEVLLPDWAGVNSLIDLNRKADEIRADLISECVGVGIERSEFEEVEEKLNLLISHTRNTGLFNIYSPLITLHHAHLAHALNEPTRALLCYQLASFLATDTPGAVAGEFVRVSARVGEVGLRIGLARTNGSELSKELIRMGEDVIEECRGMGATLEACGKVIEACLTSNEILKSKQYLKQALSLASLTQNNHLRALILAQISSHYFHTQGEHAQNMLGTCEQLAAGLGANGVKRKRDGEDGQLAKSVDSVGNAPLRLWVGERFLEIYKGVGKESKIQKQAAMNQKLMRAVERVTNRGKDAYGTRTR